MESSKSGRRVALVTGGSRGIGAAITRLLARDGFDVAINYSSNVEAALAVAEDARATGARASLHPGSIGDDATCFRVIDEVVGQYGRIDAIINNAGIASSGRAIADTRRSEIERLMAVHAYGPASLAAAAMPHLVKQERSDIIFISSAALPLFPSFSGPYSMAKAAADALARTLAYELNSRGVFVNIVAPGTVATDMGNRFASATASVQDITQLDAEMPRGHVCRPEEVAEIVAFLCSARNSYVSGQRIQVEGAQMGGAPLTARTGLPAAPDR